MEWIKAIIEKHKNEDGTYNIEEAMKEINTEFPKNAVPKDQYNNVANQLKTTNQTLKDLQEKTKDNPDIQKQLQEAQAAKEAAEKELQKLQTDVQLKEKLREAGAKDVDYMIFKLGEIEVNKDGSIKDLDNKIKSLQEANPSYFEDENEEGKGGANTPPGYQVKDNKLDKGGQTKTYTQDQLKNLTPQEINDNWEAVSAALAQGGNE
ncbi:phage scaffolding protein [Lederbergia sp. NSJ-179]|uniref:phage scaffolding protein n=1 Tax=Lederbergia sp. NSJ-179 TaxID=2931402 RepID=UPI001FD598A5|nr:phage scaffolding protein [Lederbergia sp. NSJ-179]MCJ7839975.1 phage scaffolding protein [Lederbergia sp. NSJ-179]